ncbi:hypothetical protein AN958_03213 [Leucoagaricus sp. SymC.cos]|nr:hypothetical protein AN958_03213 [Leucoagaricus sp. SymC.cos]
MINGGKPMTFAVFSCSQYQAACQSTKIGRAVEGRELATIHDYRQRLGQYRSDPDLQFSHQIALWIVVWLSAFQIGKLLDLSMLETRHYERDITDVRDTKLLAAIIPDRSLVGANQEKWPLDTLSESKRQGVIWRIIGYVKSILSYDPATGRGVIGVEFAGTGVTSSAGPFDKGNFTQAVGYSTECVRNNVDLQWGEGYYRGFFALTMNSKPLNATYYSVRNVSNALSLHVFKSAFRNFDGFASANFTVNAGENRLACPVASGHALSGALKSQVN